MPASEPTAVTLSLFNTLSRSKEPFTPIDPHHVGLYVCGPTVYDFAHIGNARPVVVFDVLFRILRHLFPHVTYVRNITDVDDKIIQAAQASGDPIERITERTTIAYKADMAALGALDPTHQPRATQFIGAMVAMIEGLVTKGFAYAADGHVLFHVPAMQDYGELSRRQRDELIAGARVEVAPYKRDPADFVLWKPSPDDQPGWPSPWGRGRPGWHIECSAMAKHHLGVTFDIHGGGLDLIFPHHENEIAQSRCSHGGAPLARYWVHNGFVTVGGEKMAKSAGNFITVRTLLEEGWPGEAVRLALLSAHYRQPLDVTRESLRQTKTILDRWYLALRHADHTVTSSGPDDQMVSIIGDDLNTPAAIAYLHDLAAKLNKADDTDSRRQAARRLRGAAGLLGLLQADPDTWLHQPSPQATEAADGLTDTAVEQMLAARTAARKARDFAEADRLRDVLTGAGIVIEDGKGGTAWRRV